jgi:glycosyltransferase involved in cell wall biosynthesis
MTPVLHMVDARTPADCLDQLSLLADPEDRVVSIGAPPAYPGLARSVEAVHCPLGIPGLTGRRLAGRFPQADLVHVWSVRSVMAGLALGEHRRCGLVLSLPCVPDPSQAANLLEDLRAGRVTVTVPTAAARTRLLSVGAPPDSVHVLPVAAEGVDGVQERRRRVRSALGLADADRLLVVPAEMTSAAGHVYAVWAHAVVRQVHPNLKLLLPGGGPVRNHVRFFAGTTGYDDEIHLTEDRFPRADALAAADIAALMCTGDCGVSALVASMAAGLPIAAGDTPDAAEVAPHEQAAILAAPATPRAASAAILRLVDDPDLGARLGATARRIAQEGHSVAMAKAALRRVYGSVV